MEKKEEMFAISRLLLNVITQFFEKDAKVNYFGTDTPLYHSEIHMLSFISEHKDLHISGIARELGLTRGAVSQTIMRLEKKGFVRKRADSKNSRRIVLEMTQKGEIACRNHERQHASYDAIVARLLKGAAPANLAFLKDFLDKFQKSM